MPIASRPVFAILLAGIVAVARADNDDSEAFQDLLDRAEAADRRGDYAAAIDLAGRAAGLRPRDSRVYNLRGAARFKAGRIAPSIEDFDRAIELDPGSKPHHWQRGISLYYAGRFADGRKQFEVHQTVNPHDVENAAWHYLCHARERSPKAAREAILPIDTERDTRIPMKEVYALFKGTGTAESVVAAALAGDPPPSRLANNLLYAHLYLGLWHEAQGETDRAREHIRLAGEKHFLPHYMGQVARVHWERMQKLRSSGGK